MFTYITKRNKIKMKITICIGAKMKRITMVAWIIIVTFLAASCGYEGRRGTASSESESLQSHSDGTVSTSVNETDVLSKESSDYYLESDGQESPILSYEGEFSPLFTYDASRDILLAYCVKDKAAMPYNLSDNVSKDGSQRTIYIPETQTEIEVFWDTGSQNWHVTAASDKGNAGYATSGFLEYVVYLDHEDLLDYSESLRRVHPAGATSKYYTVTEGICCVPQNNELQFSQDIDGDGNKEFIRYYLSEQTQGDPVQTIQLNGHNVWEDTNSDRLVYVYLMDVHEQDPYLQVCLLFEDSNDLLRTVLIYYDGYRVLSESIMGEACITNEGRIEGLSGGVVAEAISPDFFQFD
ncbi:MAG: hypothetical protein GXY06_03055 [Clostridiaceae bacterium]|nr:hypothetical protein [Clostridiaceae bacterium]